MTKQMTENNHKHMTHLQPNRGDFESDPFGYCASARNKWGLASKPATSEDLKSPILWMSQAHALTEAAITVIRRKPDFSEIPESIRSACDSQYCAVAQLLVGYSLEISLKGMLIMKMGFSDYSSTEKLHTHHRLEDLADFVPDLSVKDKAILRILTSFVTWAGRYPDPGGGKEDKLEEIFSLSEKHEITASELFGLAARVMGHTKEVFGES